MVTEQSHFLIELYGHYKNNILPLSGGLFDQPARYMRAMSIIDGAVKSE